MLMLSLDIGTTCSKAQVFDEKGNILFYELEECNLIMIDGYQYVDIISLERIVFDLIKRASQVGKINSLSLSSFGESFVALDSNDNIVYYPMLYTDNRGTDEALKIREKFSDSKLFKVTGTVPHSMYSISKLLWIKENDPDGFKRISKVMLIGDYFGYLLTGKRAIDYSLAARTGIFDIHNKCFASELLKQLGIDEKLFSKPFKTGTIVGKVTRTEAHLENDCLLVLGSHDQVCATIGSGVIDVGQSSDGMGTVECITSIFSKAPTSEEFGQKGYCVVPFLDDLYCTYMLNYTNNSIVNWFRKEILHGYKGEKDDQFSYLENSEGLTDVLLLPYFNGCATPYSDSEAKGAFLNLTVNTKDVDMYRAILEGTSFEMKLNIEVGKSYGIDVKEIVATGGGSNSDLWLTIKSDILGIPLKRLRSSEGGLCGLAMLQAKALKICETLSEAKEIFVQYKEEFRPTDTHQKQYENKYEKYKKLYHLLKEVN